MKGVVSLAGLGVWLAVTMPLTLAGFLDLVRSIAGLCFSLEVSVSNCSKECMKAGCISCASAERDKLDCVSGSLNTDIVCLIGRTGETGDEGGRMNGLLLLTGFVDIGCVVKTLTVIGAGVGARVGGGLDGTVGMGVWVLTVFEDTVARSDCLDRIRLRKLLFLVNKLFRDLVVF